eukprot:1420414-Pleurochrysis_carterae.AAC.2
MWQRFPTRTPTQQAAPTDSSLRTHTSSSAMQSRLPKRRSLAVFLVHAFPFRAANAKALARPDCAFSPLQRCPCHPVS